MTPILWHNSISLEIVRGDGIIRNAEITWYKLAYSLLVKVCGLFMLKAGF